ncbi:MAG: hypothetical protein A2140_07665 [Candidatus Muproteobacteria bacterium RBG_16_62_13]|uniref:Thiol:disulfide interchange protein n=1 Tax=Candidatus Muproteobacteria bacterium RBG_16_62_13 TaxID=1817756 RepID=A0A1F6SXW6_9PROT|nr:MAG: hypothetical protein A2140_07665 [Candidatus Muproteobacteria bacterium RBG_16_62_13]
MLRIFPVLSLMGCLLMSGQSLAADDYSSLRKKLASQFPALAKATIKPTPSPWLVQVEFGSDIAYATKDGKFLLLGELINVESRANLTKLEQERLQSSENKQIAAIMAGLKDDTMIVMGPRQAKVTMTVFTDVDCTYCARFHLDVPELNRNGVRVRYLLYPRAGVGSDSYRKAVAAWCAPDRVKAIGMAKAGQPIDMKTCANPVDDHMRLAEQLGVSGTPTIFLDNGRRIGGYLPARQMLVYIGIAPGGRGAGR